MELWIEGVVVAWTALAVVLGVWFGRAITHADEQESSSRGVVQPEDSTPAETVDTSAK